RRRSPGTRPVRRAPRCARSASPHDAPDPLERCGDARADARACGASSRARRAAPRGDRRPACRGGPGDARHAHGLSGSGEVALREVARGAAQRRARRDGPPPQPALHRRDLRRGGERSGVRDRGGARRPAARRGTRRRARRDESARALPRAGRERRPSARGADPPRPRHRGRRRDPRPTATVEAPRVSGTIAFTLRGDVYILREGKYFSITSEGRSTEPSLSPDGRTVVFARTEQIDGKREVDGQVVPALVRYTNIVKKDASGGPETIVLDGLRIRAASGFHVVAWQNGPAISPDGKRLAIVTDAGEGSSDLEVYDLAT